MANNEENLVSLADRTTEERRAIVKKGGIASGEARKQQADRKLFYDNLPNQPELKSKEDYLLDIKEYCEETIKRCSGYISDSKKNIKRMKKQDEATHKLFESLKIFD